MAHRTWPIPRAKYENDAAGEDAEVRWQRAFEDAFREGTLTLDATGSSRIRTLRGNCPRCGHGLKGIDIYGSIIRGVTQVKNGVALTNIVCNCDTSHPGRPDGKSGCGWAPNLVVTIIWPETESDSDD